MIEETLETESSTRQNKKKKEKKFKIIQSSIFLWIEKTFMKTHKTERAQHSKQQVENMYSRKNIRNKRKNK